jgi:pilus assembly protein CpaE
MAEVECEFASAQAAIECLRRSKKQPRLLIVQMNRERNATEIRRLSEYLTHWPILALVPGGPSGEDILQANRAGASQIVALPPDPEDFHQALRVIGSHFGRDRSDRLVLAVAGAVGGCGATTLAINLASEIAQRFRRSTILAELAPQIGALSSMLEIQPRLTFDYLLQEIDRVDDLLIEKSLVPMGDGFKVLAGPNEVSTLPPVDLGRLETLVGQLKKAAEVTVLDVPGAFDEVATEALHASDHVILVGSQNIPSMRALKVLRDTFPEERITHSLWVVINRYDPGSKGLTKAEIQERLQIPRLQTVSNDYRAVSRAITQGCPLRKAAPETPILRDLDELIHALLGLERSEGSRKRGNALSGVFSALRF